MIRRRAPCSLVRAPSEAGGAESRAFVVSFVIFPVSISIRLARSLATGAHFGRMDVPDFASAPEARHYAPDELPSPFLSTRYSPALQPSDLYGARLKATLNHVKRELGAMRVDLEGVLQLRDELDSVRTELALVRGLVDTQGKLADRRDSKVDRGH